jgi:chorismate mutase-like protein
MRVLSVLVLAVALLVPAAAAQADDLSGAREVLALTQQRLSYMETVVAAKWATRSPIEDAAQEERVLASARDLATERELNPASVAHLFRAQITAAKDIQLGWGEEWLLHGYPADRPVPDLASVRPQIAAVAPAIADALTHTERMHCVRNAYASLMKAARATITVRFADDALRRQIVDAILRVRPESRRAPCSHI